MMKSFASALVALILTFRPAHGAAVETTVVRSLPVSSGPAYYPANVAPLAPTPLIKLPPGAVVPKGWLRQQLELDAAGLPGRLDDISRFLQFGDKNGWVNPDSVGDTELTYWLRGYGDLGYVLHDPRILATSKKWIDAIIATAQPDGYFGPKRLKPEIKNGVYDGKDPCAHQLVMFPLCSYYDYSGDPRILPLMDNFYKWVATQPNRYFTSGWGALRWADVLLSVYWLYDRNHDPALLTLATRIQNTAANYVTNLGNGHNVNWSQSFRMPAEYSQQANDPVLRATSGQNYDKVMGIYGQFATGGLAGDESYRSGYIDPRQGMETCGFVEYMQSFEILQRITGDPTWADRCENIAFNSLPATTTPDHHALHYITSANSIDLNRQSKQLGQFANGPFPMLAYEPSPHNYRCCTHNYGMGWPYFTESLWGATTDLGLCAAMYSPSEVTAKVGDGTPITLKEETDYPFSDTIKFSVQTSKPLAFPLYFRVPGWTHDPQLQVNGQDVSVAAAPLSYIRIARTWAPGDTVTLRLPMKVNVEKWASNRDSVSVFYGPLDFSLDIKEKWTPYVPEKYNQPGWGGYEVSPLSAWSYGLALDDADPSAGFEVVRQPGPLADQPFTHETIPLLIKAKVRRIDQWTADGDDVVGPLQQSPALTNEPVDTVSLIPAGAARLRITSFPTASTGPEAHVWTPAPSNLTRITASYVEWPFFPGALDYGVEPTSSHDLSRPHFIWARRQGTQEWIQFHFPGPVTVSAVAPYWFIDHINGQPAIVPAVPYHGEGQSLAPQSWSVQYYDGKGWKPVETMDSYGTTPDQYNKITFKPVTAYSLRLLTQLSRAGSAGLYVVKIFDGDTQLVPSDNPHAVQFIKASATSESQAPVAERMYQAGDLKLDDNAPVKIWPDTSSGGADATVPLGKVQPPTFDAKGIDNQPAVHFDGSKRQVLAFPRPTADDFTIAVVFQSSKGDGGGSSFASGSSLLQGFGRSAEDDFGISLNRAGQVLAGTGNPDVSLASHPQLNDAQPHLVIFTRIKANGDLNLSVDGTPVGHANSTNFTSLISSNQLGIGATPRGDAPFTGDIGEVLYFTDPLSDADRQALEKSLMSQWGVK